MVNNPSKPPNYANWIMILPRKIPCSMSSKVNMCPPILYAIDFQKFFTPNTEDSTPSSHIP